jgi:hypothetical protein
MGFQKNAREPIHGGLGRAIPGAPHFLKPHPACPLFNLVVGIPGNGNGLQPALTALLSDLSSFFSSHSVTEWQSPTRGLGGEIFFPPGKRCLSEASCFSQGKKSHLPGRQ